jgi:hypothetical protein
MWAVFTVQKNHAWLSGVFDQFEEAEAFQQERGGQVSPMGKHTFPVYMLHSGTSYRLMDRKMLEDHLDALRVGHVIAIAGVPGPDPVDVYTFQKPWQSPELTDCLAQVDHAHIDREFIALMEEEGGTAFAFGPLS